MPVKIKSKAFTTVEQPGKLPVQKEIDGPAKVVPDAHALVGVHFDRKWSDGNYGSTAVGVSVTVPCDPSKLSEGYEEAAKFANEKMDELLAGTGQWQGSTV